MAKKKVRSAAAPQRPSQPRQSSTADGHGTPSPTTVRPVKFAATFKAHVLAIEEFSIHGQDVELLEQGDGNWKGGGTIAVSANSVPFKLTFRAPSFTKFKLSITAGRKSAYKQEGTSNRTIYTIEDTVTIPPKPAAASKAVRSS